MGGRESNEAAEELVFTVRAQANCEVGVWAHPRAPALTMEEEAAPAWRWAVSSLGDALDECAALRAQLATVEKERDIERSRANDARDKMYNNVAGLNAALTRVKALEAALEPTAEVRREYVIELMANAEFDETADAIVAMDGLLHAIRARAGLTKEGG